MYTVSIQNKAVRKFPNLSSAVSYLRGEIYVPDTTDYIAGHIDNEGYYRAVYGFNYGEIHPPKDITYPAWALYQS